MGKLSTDEIVEKLTKLPGWKLKSCCIEKEFVFKDFKTAFSVMTHIAFEAEAMNHHPDWLNVYNKLKITLTTHDADGLTLKDFDLAVKIETIVKSHFFV